MTVLSPSRDAVLELQDGVGRFVRAFGLHRPNETPCGEPVPTSEAFALVELAADAPLSAKDLTIRLQLEKSSVSRMLEQMERKGWIQREANPLDRRLSLLTLTALGRQREQGIAKSRSERFAAVLDAIPLSERETVAHGLRVLIEACTHAEQRTQ